MQLHVSKQFGRGFQFQTSYTWSKTIDDSTTSTTNTDYREGSTSRPYNTKVDRGLSALHQAHNLVLNGIWAVPFPANLGVASRILGGWNLSGIFSASAGIPFSVKTSGSRAPDLGVAGLQRPDFVSGHSSQSLINKGNVDQYYDVTAYSLPPVGFYRNLGRNTLIGPGFASVDIGLRKDIPLGKSEGKRLEFRADAFNLLNRANFAPPANTVLNGANGSLVAGAGKITRTVSTSRQMQFGLKLVFSDVQEQTEPALDVRRRRARLRDVQSEAGAPGTGAAMTAGEIKSHNGRRRRKGCSNQRCEVRTFSPSRDRKGVVSRFHRNLKRRAH